MTEEEILQLRGDKLDIVVAEVLGWRRYKEGSEWWIEPDDEHFHLIPAIDNDNYWDQKSGSESVDFNPSKNLTQALEYCSEDGWEWELHEYIRQSLLVYKQPVLVLKAYVETPISKYELSVSSDEFGYSEHVEMYCTARCVLWLLAKWHESQITSNLSH